MLKFFSRMERTRNFVLLIFAIIMVVSLIIFYAPTRSTVRDDLARSTETAVQVGKEEITVGEIATLKQGRNSAYPTKMLLNPLISQRLVRLEAERLGLTATDAEVAAQIRNYFKTPDGKPFDQRRYEQIATDQAGSVAAFEQNARDEMSGKKLEAYLTSGVTVSEEEVLSDYQRKNTKFDLSYVPVSAADVALTIKPTDEELKSYFEQNKGNYRITSPQKKIRYAFLSTAKIGEKLNISDADLQAEFDKVPADKKIKGVEGQEIVLRIPKPEFEQQILEKANSLVTQARKDGTTVSAEAFGTLAKGHSENPATAPNGGKIPNLVKEIPNNPTDPYQQLLKMQPGEVSEPVTYQGRIYILRRGEAVPKTFQDADTKKELEVSLRNRRAYTAAAEIAQKMTDRLKEVKDVQKVAAEFASQANMSATEMIRETGFVKPGDDVKDIGISPQFEEGIAGLNNPNDVGDKIPVKDGFAIPLLVEKREPRDAEFAEVKEQVAEAVKLEQARSRIEQIAKQIAEGAGSAGNLAAIAQSKGMKAQEAKSFILGSPLGQGPTAATSKELEDAVYALKQGEVTKTPVKINDNWYIVGVSTRTEANMDEFAKERDQLVESMLTQKRQQVFSDYIGAIRQKMEADGDIKTFPDALAKLDELEADQPSQMPGLPPGFPPQGQ